MIPMRLFCPICDAQHIDEGEFATKEHHSHACQSCGAVWRPAIVATVGVQFLPGFKNTLRPAKPTDIPQQPQHQGSTVDQLVELIIWANRLGLYDAADFVSTLGKGKRP